MHPSLSVSYRTTIFTLDSLGSKHPRAVNILKQYLIAEAEDKKQLQNTNPALGRTLSVSILPTNDVPTQPNYCDCGVYLIHFAQVFVQRAEYFANISVSCLDHSIITLSKPRTTAEERHAISN
ncbi:hypothetical protein C8R42DRAFT_587771 [Lentinula raphanica]|nr:hypothetical protein C8R42DRAFT_587771 [Lentinula raphanica]